VEEGDGYEDAHAEEVDEVHQMLVQIHGDGTRRRGSDLGRDGGEGEEKGERRLVRTKGRSCETSAMRQKQQPSAVQGEAAASYDGERERERQREREENSDRRRKDAEVNGAQPEQCTN
jgi:hypothetical protein